jgi:SAM-dependent methyltransferase
MFDPNRNVGPESRKSYADKVNNGFIQKYLSGQNVLDVGFVGYSDNGVTVVPIVENAIGIDVGYPGYDGLNLPFPDQSQDAVYSSHCLEHVDNSLATLAEWFRVLRIGGYMVIVVPHQQLYEKTLYHPSRFAGYGHRRFYLPNVLLTEIQQALPYGEWRLRHMVDNDAGFDYNLPATQHSAGCYEIECVIERIARPAYIDEMFKR